MPATYEPIATTTLGSAQSSITFSSISASYTDLVIVLTGRDTYSADVASSLIRFNSDSGTNYSYTALQGNGSTATSYRSSNSTVGYIGELAAANSASGTFTPSIIQVQNYSNTTTFKTAIVRGSAGNLIVNAIVNLWRSTAAINSVTLIPSTTYVAGTTATLYGIKAA